jgi:hypothetical protein
MKPQTLGLIVAASILGAILFAGAAVMVAWDVLMPPEAPNPFAGRVAPKALASIPPVPPEVAMQMPGWNGAFLAPVRPEKVGELRGPVPARDLKISGPHSHNNLSLFLIHGPNTWKGKEVLTLHQALNRGLAVVHDTRTSMLTVNNRSAADLYIQSGDIVKGGIQDRTIQFDMLIRANSGPVPLAAFCVEQGRSFARGGEPVAVFGCATEQLPGKRLRLANLHQQSQLAIWQGVSRIQRDLEANVGDSVRSALSTTSLQLTLEHNCVGHAVQNYLQELSPVVEGKKDVVGVVVAVNGRIHSVDLYASADLCRNLWPKLLRSGAIEALAERGRAQANLPTADSVQAFLAEAEKGTTHHQPVNDRCHMLRQERPTSVLFDACDKTQGNVVIHRCVLVK